MLKVSFHTLGCKVNQYETDAMIELFQQRGYEVVDFSESADISIINTCTVTNVADKKSRKMLSKAKKINEQGIVVAVGCYAQIAENKLQDNTEIDLIIGSTNKNQIVDRVEHYLAENHKAHYIEDVSQNMPYEEMWISKVEDKKRAHIKIQDGCNQFCSYCIIPFTRGRVRSREPENILKEVKQLVEKGYKEIVLTGIHLASYEIKEKDFSLLNLLQALNNIRGLERIRLGSLEPTLMTESFIREMGKLKKVCTHFHLSLQSGCDETLIRMNRHYTTQRYIESVERLKKEYDLPAITTDIIVGFPGETEEEFEQTCLFVKEVGFADVHIFKYSPRKGTQAAGMKNQVPESVKNERSKVLMGIRDTLHEAYLQSFIGTTLEVLFEDTNQAQQIAYSSGHTQNYIKVKVQKPDQNLENQIATVLITGINEENLEGRLLL